MQTQNNQKSSLYSRINSLMTLFMVGALVFSTDQLTKLLVLNNLTLYESWAPIPFLERIFKITYTFNTGAAFGLFAKNGNFFMIIAVVVAMIIVYYIASYPSLPGIVQISLGLQLGGALGNMWDRVQYGSVVDFVDIGFWPIFNVADISIMTGVGILALWLWQEDEKQKDHVKQNDYPHQPEEQSTAG